MPRYIIIEDNEDGTMTTKINLDGQDVVCVLEVPFDDLLGMMLGSQAMSEVREEVVTLVEDKLTFIPDTLEE